MDCVHVNQSLNLSSSIIEISSSILIPSSVWYSLTLPSEDNNSNGLAVVEAVSVISDSDWLKFFTISPRPESDAFPRCSSDEISKLETIIPSHDKKITP